MERLINEYNAFCGTDAKMEYDEFGKSFFMCGRLQKWICTEHGNGFRFESIYSDSVVIYAENQEEAVQLILILHNTK